MEKTEWLYCPICGNKTRNKVRADTELKNYPLFCPKCKKETLIDVKKTKNFCDRQSGVTNKYFALVQHNWEVILMTIAICIVYKTMSQTLRRRANEFVKYHKPLALYLLI